MIMSLRDFAVGVGQALLALAGCLAAMALAAAIGVVLALGLAMMVG